MDLNFNVKVKAGPRTPAQVSAYSTAANKKILTLTNGKTITNVQIAEWLQDELQRALSKLESRQTNDH